MSFDKLVNPDFILKEKTFSITGSDGDYKFKAVAPSYTQRLAFSVAKNNGGDFFMEMILSMIVDEAGQKMSREQADKLPDEVIARFISECVPLLGDVSDDKKKTKQ